MVKKRQAVSGVRQVRNTNSEKWLKKITAVMGLLWKPKLITTGLCVLSVVVAYKNINLQQVLPISAVKIEGEFNYLDKEQLRKQTMPVVNGGFFSVDLPAIRNALVNVAWVEDVSVRRQWPDGLLVRVIEKQPVAYWGKNSLLSSKGIVFVPHKKLVTNMPELEGPDGQHAIMLKELARMQAWLSGTGLYINKMKLDARRSWTIQMSEGLELRLGRKQMHERLQRFASVYKNNLQAEKREIKHIDMRYTNGFAVAWKEA